ncbi:MAG TPA: L,D-transpeptidase [Halothiobacillus sp.]|nr:L,D-transpeptidase [Halothiobacillus sp.]
MFSKLFKILFIYGLLGCSSAMANAADTGLSQPAVQAAQIKIERLLSASHAGDAPFIIIDAKNQTLYLFEHKKLKQSFPVSTSAVGVGNAAGSNRTPLGLHKIAEKFGDGEPVGMIFKARKPSGALASIQTRPIKGDGDDVTTRIMWLQGLEPGVNEGQGIDSHARYIYIHGTPEEGLIGTPESHGCVRMNNTQVIELFNQVPVGTLVDIVN